MAEDDTHTPLEEAIAKTARALSERPDLEVSFLAAAPSLVGNRLSLPPPDSDPSIRGIADRLALKAAHHDADLHATCVPRGGEAQTLFDTFEAVRTEAIGASMLRGVKANLQALAAQDWLRRAEPHAPEALMPLLLREAVAGIAPPQGAEAQLKRLRDELPSVIFDDLAALKPLVNDQAAYGQKVAELLVHFGIDEQEDAATPEPDDDTPEDPTPDPDDDTEDEEQPDTEPDSGQDEQRTPEPADTASQDPHESTKGPPEEDDELAPPRPQPEWLNLPGTDVTYRVFTSAHDEVIGAEHLADADELQRLRQYLDTQSQKLDPLVARLANRLQRRLIAQQQQSWVFDLEEGLLDTARLTRVITDPTAPLSFKQESDQKARNTVVTLLLDNSGSMRGRPMLVAALCADVVARTLERCGVKCEILGYTTRTWKGGLSREDWMAAGKPPHPGRLNDLRHIIYKRADTPWRRARINLGLMMREGLLKENIDGEALAWAATRLLRRAEERRILMVISDGAPVDDSTLSTNPGHILESHLRSVIDYLERLSPIELVAIGIGHDVTRYYSRAVTIPDVDSLGETLMQELEGVFIQARN